MDIARFHSNHGMLPTARPPTGTKCIQIIRHFMYALCASKELCNLSCIKLGH